MQSDNIKDSIKDNKKDEIMSDIKSFISIKMERIAVAAYKVTDFLSPEEPLKWKIRLAATEGVTVHPTQIVEPLFRLTRLFSVAKEAGIGSSMNFGILLDECESLNAELVEEGKKTIQREVLTKAHGSTPYSSIPVPNPQSTKRQTDYSREEKIITILKEMGESSIRAIADKLPSVSEKTVQRELITLVEKGIVNKTGERRWSRYQLALPR